MLVEFQLDLLHKQVCKYVKEMKSNMLDNEKKTIFLKL